MQRASAGKLRKRVQDSSHRDGSVKQGLVRAAFWFENNSFLGQNR
jgi:hypothetical protein